MPNPPAIMHWTYPLPVIVAGARNIYTMHDLVPLRLPYTTLDHKEHYAALIRACASRADQICTVSAASAQDIIGFTGLPAERVTNTYQASTLPDLAHLGSAAADAAIVEGLFGLTARSYFLFYGALEPKKNVGRMLQAFLGLSLASSLVIVGGRAWKSEGELALLQGGNETGGDPTRSRIIKLDYLPRELLTKLIRGARAVLFPSLFEGFGLPALEAMQLGTPVLTSNTASLPEVVGDAAVKVDPYDVEAIAAGITALDTDAGLRSRLEAAGPRQAALFSRQRYLERLEAMYTDVLDRS
jgi:glycosyltransferase involved in cell wall biosynthesis